MKNVLTILLCVAFLSFQKGNVIDQNEVLSTASKELVYEQTDHELLNRTVFELINQERKLKKLPLLKRNEKLGTLAKSYQSTLEFKSFKNPLRIESKINKKLTEKAKKRGYKGGILQAVALQHNGINYEKDRPFFYRKDDQKNQLGMYYGSKKELKKNPDNLTPIPNYTYVGFAKALLSQLSKKQKKMLYSKSYEDLGIQLNWHYKSLHKRKIPQIKLVVLLGGYVTLGIR